MYSSFMKSKIMLQVLNFPTSMSLNIWWNIGFVLNLLVVFQVVIGVMLSCFMVVGELGLISKFLLIKEMNLGWLLINSHNILTSFIFMFLYLHIFKGLIFPTYPFMGLWFSGFLIFSFFILMSFSGYSLLGSAVSILALNVGSEIVCFMFGEKISSLILFSLDSGISGATLHKIFILHYTFSFLILGLMVWHLKILHEKGGNNNGKVPSYVESFKFSLYMFVKDLKIFNLLLVWLFFIIFFIPENFLTGEGSVQAFKGDTMEINVEWYLSIFFVMLSALNSKLFGIVFMIFPLFLLVLNYLYKDFWGSSSNLNLYTLSLLFSMGFLLKISSYSFSFMLNLMPSFLLMLFNNFLKVTFIKELYCLN